MLKMDKDKLKDIVSSLMFEPTDDVLLHITENWTEIQRQLSWLDELDLANIDPMTHINENYQIDFLRDDEVDTTWSITKADILKNAADKDSDYVILTKVVK